MVELTYQWDAGLPAPILCTFEETEDGPRLVGAFVGAIDIYLDGFGNVLSQEQVRHIESIAYTPLMRQAEQINAERRAEFLPWRGLARRAA